MKYTRFERVLAWILMAVVFVVCVSPAVDLDDCSLRSDQLSTLIFSLFALFALVVAVTGVSQQPHTMGVSYVAARGRPLSTDPYLIDRIRTRRI